MPERLDFFKLARSLDILHDPFAAFGKGEAGVWAGFRLHHRESVDNLAKFQIVLFAQLPVVGVVAWRYLERARAEFLVNVFVRNNRNLAPDDWHHGLFANQCGISFILRMDTDGGIARNGLRPCGGYGNRAVGIGKPVADMPEKTVLVLPVNLVIGKGCLAARAPVDHVVAAINQPFVVKLDKNLAHGP